MKIKLEYKLIYLYTGLICILVVIISVTSTKVFYKSFNEYIQERQDEKILKLVEKITNLYNDNNQVKYEDLYNIGIDALDNGLVMMVNKDFANQIICISDILVDESEEMLLQMETILNKTYPHIDGGYKEDYYPIIDNENNVHGYITVGYYGPIYISEYDALFLKSVKNAIYQIAGVFVIVSSIFIYIFSKRLTNSISKLNRKAIDIINGDYSKDFDLSSNTTEIYHLTQSINILSKNLEKQKQVKKQLAQNYTHELRTPITCVLTTLEGIKDGVFELNEERLESLYSEMTHISTLVSGVDNLIETRDFALNVHKTSFDIYSLLRNCVDNFEMLFENKNINLIAIYDEKESCYINADEEKIKSVITNILSNALKYTDSGGTVKIFLYSKQKNIFLKIEDNGIGIEENEQKLIFDEMYRVEKNRVKEVEGFGLGLSICKNIVEAHNGEIYVNSVLGKGSEFIVKLPI